MNSREFDGLLDDLVQQALYPFAEAQPPARVWRRVLSAVRSLRVEHAAGAGLWAAFSRWAEFFFGMKGTHVTYVPLVSNRPYYVESHGRGLPSPFWDIALKQMFDMRLAS